MKRNALLFIIAAFALTALPALAADSYYQVSAADVSKAVGDALAKRGIATKVSATVISGTDVLYEANKPLTVAVQALTYETPSQRWEANMHVLSKGETVTVMPIKGRYEPMLSVPVLKRQMSASDVITTEDIAHKDILKRHLRKDSITQESDLVGKSPRRFISEDRPIRMSEINLPTLVKKGSQVSVNYSSPHMSIQMVGLALEDGSKGSLVRIQNVDTKRAFTARVINENHVEANIQPTMMN